MAHSQTVANPMKPIPIPAQVPAKDGVAQIPDTRLWYWDTGGPGRADRASASGDRQRADLGLPAAGVRQGRLPRHRLFAARLLQLRAVRPEQSGIGSEDLRHLADVLGLRRFHVVASAAGGSIASDFAFSYQDRLLSLTISSNSFGVRDGEIAKAAAFIRPKGWEQMPAEFRELGPSYRAANPEGVKAWMELEHKALIGREYRQTLKNEITQARLKELKLPTLLIAGAADMSTPPSISRMIAAEIPNSRVVLMPEAGHSSIGSSRRSSIAPCSTSSAASRNSATASVGAGLA